MFEGLVWGTSRQYHKRWKYYQELLFSKNNVDEKYVITYINHLKVIDIRKDIRSREAEERKRQEEEGKYKDFKWDTLI